MDRIQKMFIESVRKELLEMKRIGIKVPTEAIKRTENKEEMLEYYEGGMSISECADLLISLSS